MEFNSLRLDSPFKDNRSLFGSLESSPDLSFIIPNRQDPVQIHRGILTLASAFVRGVMRCKLTVNSEDKDTFEWPFESSTECEPLVMFNILRFFYGFSLIVRCEGEELCATIATLRRLQANCEDALERIESFALKEAKHTPAVGAQLLLACQKYDECHSDRCGGLHIKLARIVLTPKNMETNTKIVVDSCLMQLPLKYFDLATFGHKGTPSSEFSVWTRYLVAKTGQQYQAAHESFLKRAVYLHPSSDELKRAWAQKVIDDEMLRDMCFRAWSSEEKQSKELRNQLGEMKKREEMWAEKLETEKTNKQRIAEVNKSLQRRIQMLEEELALSQQSAARPMRYPV